MDTFSKTVISITGAASGIGRETACYLASRGASLSLADINDSGLSKLKLELDTAYPLQHFHAQQVDVRSRHSVASWLTKTTEILGPLDGAVNLAAVLGKDNLKASIESIDDDDWNWVMDVILKGTLNCLREEIPRLRDGGAIVNGASIAGFIGLPMCAAYVASKHAVLGLTKTAAKELAERNIRVNAIAPGPIDTPLLRGNGSEEVAAQMGAALPMKRVGKVSEVAPLIAFLLDECNSFMTGSIVRIDGGLLS